MDIEALLFIAVGSSMKSEGRAYDRTIKFLSSSWIEIDSIYFDKYYSSHSYMARINCWIRR